MKNGERIKKVYPYYGCSNNNCTQRANINKTKLENDFLTLLNKAKVDHAILMLIPLQFEEEAKKNQRKKDFIIEDHKKRVQELGSKLEQIEASLLRTSIPKLYEKLEIERNCVNEEKTNLEETLTSNSNDHKRIITLLEKTIKLFQNP